MLRGLQTLRLRQTLILILLLPALKGWDYRNGNVTSMFLWDNLVTAWIHATQFRRSPDEVALCDTSQSFNSWYYSVFYFLMLGIKPRSLHFKVLFYQSYICSSFKLKTRKQKGQNWICSQDYVGLPLFGLLYQLKLCSLDFNYVSKSVHRTVPEDARRRCSLPWSWSYRCSELSNANAQNWTPVFCKSQVLLT